MKNVIITSLLLAGLSTSVNAHEVWINTGSFELNSDEQTTYSLDVARSAEAFIAEANHHVSYLNVLTPSGQKKRLDAVFSGKNKEVFEQNFSESGTYHFRSPATQVFLTFYRDAAGKKHKIGLPKSRYNELPDNIKIERTVEKQMITEAYISYNGFSDPQYNKAQQGITIIPSKHPNMFTTGDKISFTALFEGKPLANAEFAIKSLNSIYHPEFDQIELMTDKDGQVEFTPSDSGRYIVAVEHAVTLKNTKEADQRSVELFLSFDVVN
ncbi:DUF4198 domain-containing protein [Shewanella eurypsychrophilus]|uniref:DUF4198 domain-containing protein n=1 Tax=Shewanella eurypsychrophilus TaxID=2593656 RepID=A0ABX6V4A0_9GAMM|nr:MULTISPECIES: DUF4198 domain-containing protein [Shewanella]QFU22194.1 DUF4198 domain-containing protein [Shewanella sp. YLB-09]QPG57480.1 DUF4198 domain-containing protein [Shewanella eurypsychrophilus]